MSTITDVISNEESLFIPTKDDTRTTEQYTPKAKGDYLGHIVELRTSTREFDKQGRRHKAHIFNFKVRVAPANKTNTYTFTTRDGETFNTDGSPYVGHEFNAVGVFRYLEPTKDDTFESNAEDNSRYMRFCQALGVEVETTKRTVNDKTVEVMVLPHLNEKDIEGTPVIAVVDRGNDWVNSDGKTSPSWEVKYVKRWEDGTRLPKGTNNDLPF
tara:strand:+ start:1367 stop:2005 length:639 start_codon:yes stop_codon:yes gene_type:complete